MGRVDKERDVVSDLRGRGSETIWRDGGKQKIKRAIKEG